MGHIINLSAQSFLHVTDKEAVDEAQMIEGVSTTLAEVSEWRKKGCLGQLHNIVVHFQLSSRFECTDSYNSHAIRLSSGTTLHAGVLGII